MDSKERVAQRKVWVEKKEDSQTWEAWEGLFLISSLKEINTKKRSKKL